MHTTGLMDITLNQLISFKIHDVEKEYIEFAIKLYKKRQKTHTREDHQHEDPRYLKKRLNYKWAVSKVIFPNICHSEPCAESISVLSQYLFNKQRVMRSRIKPARNLIGYPE